MEIKSTIKYVRMSPRKLRPLARLFHEKSVSETERYLEFMPDKSGKLILEALRTAIADAKNNFKKEKNDLVVKAIQILESTKMKRFRPVSRGTAHSYKKRMSHIEVVLSDRREKNSKQ